MRSVHLVVTGRVQGVGFRAFVVRHASELGLAGWVRNRHNGTVEAMLEGPAAAIADMIGRCRQGPRFAAVGDVAVTDQPLQGFARFAVAPTV